MGASDEDAESSDSVARRHFLRAAIYVAPAIVSTVVVRTAAAQPMTSCMPDLTPCMPNMFMP